jgi:hypothetical protein
MMQPDLAFSLVTGVVLILLVVLSHWLWRGGKTARAPIHDRSLRHFHTHLRFFTKTLQPFYDAFMTAPGASAILLITC